MPPPDDTARLLRLWYEGDRDALLTLVDRDRDWVERQLRRGRGPVVRGLEETVDGVQDLMLHAMDYAPRFIVGDRGQFRALLARMIRHQIIDRARQAERRPRGLTMSEADASRARLDLTGGLAMTPPDAAAARAEELAWMRVGLEFLPDDERRLIMMRTFEEREFADVGAELGASANTARMRFNRAVLRLAGLVQRLQRGELGQLLAEREDPDALLE
ncbi:MAG: sigma-70 family RNA polymerase sigma factor [Planctomycetes bacterium]|nr:sigma-70 family RNA polymerase sigma factor [Planctomycetota bacterium]